MKYERSSTTHGKLLTKRQPTYADRVGIGGLPLADGRGLLLSEGRGFLLSEGRGAGEPDGGGAGEPDGGVGRPLPDGRGGRTVGRGTPEELGGGRTLSLGLGTPDGSAVGLGLS